MRQTLDYCVQETLSWKQSIGESNGKKMYSGNSGSISFKDFA